MLWDRKKLAKRAESYNARHTERLRSSKLFYTYLLGTTLMFSIGSLLVAIRAETAAGRLIYSFLFVSYLLYGWSIVRKRRGG